ncbi:MAG: 1-phosphofructokinase [Clostridiales bacterium]|nr:1-phosphofructokinase [Clostridiales bacterium]
MIYTITLNPAIDKTIILDSLKKGQVNRSIYSRDDAGGKGINVAKVIKNLGYDVCAMGLIGEENKEDIYKKLEKGKIKYEFIEVDGETRTNIKIVEKEAGIFTDINQAGFEAENKDVERLTSLIESKIKDGDVVVLSGSIPKGIDGDIYKFMIRKFKEKGAKVIFDADGEVLRYGLEECPYLIKPNINELKSIINCNDDIESIKQATKELVDRGIKTVVSMGEKGALYIDNKNILLAKPIRVDVKSTVGAGDSMVAAFAIGIHEKMTIEETFRLGVASSTAKITKEGSLPPSREEILKYIELVEIQRR